MGWVLAAACAVLTPAVVHGALGTGASLYDPITFDQVDELIPWSTLAWTQVHLGHLPLWNPYSVLGMPLAFNWQSAPFSLPSLIGYLFPLHLAYTVQMLATLIVAGSGVYVLGRVMGLGVLGCTFGATVFELSGAFVGWLGWPVASVMSWAGWLLAAAILVIRGRKRGPAIALLALVTAFAIYAGQPDTLVVLGVAVVLFLVVALGALRFRVGDHPSTVRTTIDLFLGAFAGMALGAPILLPGAQLARGANRNKYAMVALPVHDVFHVIFQGFDGVPVAGGQWFGGMLSYEYSSAYVGIIALVLAGFAVWWRRHDVEVLAFGVVAVVMAGVVFVPPVVRVLDTFGAGVLWNRGIFLMTFALSVLAGVGLDGLVRRCAERRALVKVAVGFTVSAVVLGAIWVFGRGHLDVDDARVRAHSFIWPAVETALGLGAVTTALWVRRRLGGTSPTSGAWSDVGRWMGLVLLVCETAFLVAAGAPLWSAGRLLTPTHSENALERAVGGSVVGFGSRSCFPNPTVGILADINVERGVHELSVYDPTIPRGYFSTWRALTGEPGGNGLFQSSFFCPTVTSTAVARRFGVGFVLTLADATSPPGMAYVGTIGDEKLYRVPDAQLATVTPIPHSGGGSGPDSRGTPVSIRQSKPGSMTITTDGAVPSMLRLRITDVPGWHATIDGRIVPLQPFSTVMLQVRVPAGHHVVKLVYWPTAFTVGIVLAICALISLVVALVGASLRRAFTRAPTEDGDR